MASFIAPMLKDVLSKYFSNFEADKLTLGMLGNVTLSDLALQTDVLDQFNLPFRVLGGRVGTLYLDIGLGGLAKLAFGSTTVIEATLTDVHILAVPPSTFPYDKEKAEAEALSKKRTELSSIAEKQKAAAEAAAKGDSGGGFINVPNMILGIINNIKVKIENIHIRYEDDKLKPESPFSLGLVLGSLEAETCDKDWEPAKVELDPTFFKIVRLEKYGIYWNSYEKNLIGAGKSANADSLDGIVSEMKALTADANDDQLKFVLGPLETKVKAMVTLNPEKLAEPFSLPKADIKVEMPELAIGLSNEQFGEALILAESLEVMKRAMPYRKHRPFNTPVKGHAKEWWRFAFNCTMEEVKRRKQNCTWDYWKAHREMVKKYTAAYPPIARGTATDEEKDALQKLEDQMDNISIMTARNKIDLTVTREKEMIKAKSGYWSTYELTEDDLQEILTKDMSEEEKLAYTTKVEEEAKPVVYPTESDYTEIRANVDLAKTTLKIVNTSKDSEKVEKVLNLVINKFTANVETHPVKEGLRVDAAMSTISITGVEQEGRPVPQLLKSVGEESAEFVSMTFEKNPFDSKAASRVKFSSERTDVIYHAPTVQKLVDTFTWPDQVELASARASVSSSLENFKETSLDGMQDMVKDTSQIDVDIKVTAPRILVPQNGELSDAASVLIVNLGTLTVKSISHPDAETLDLKALLESATVDPALAKLVYNDYTVKLSDFEVLMALAGENLDLADHPATLGEPSPLLKKGEIAVELSQSKITTDPRFPKLKIDVKIPLLDVDITESRMDKLAYLALTFPIPVMAPPRPAIVEVKNDPKANYDAEVDKLIKSAVVVGGAAEKSEKVQEVIPADFNPETATQLTSLFAHIYIQGVKLRISKVENAEVVPVLDILAGILDATAQMRTYGISVAATLSGFVFTYSGAKIKGHDGPVNLLETPISSGTPLLTLNLFMLNADAPKLESGSVKMRVNAQITSLNVTLHQEAIAALLVSADRISKNLAKIKEEKAAKKIQMAGASETEAQKADAIEVAAKAAKSEKPEEKNPNDLDMKVNAVLTSFSLQLTSEEKRIAEVSIRELSAEYEDGSVKSTVVVKLEAVELLDTAETTKYRKIVSVTGQEKLLYVQLLMFKESSSRAETEPDMDVTLNLGSPRVMIIGSFFGNVLNFVSNFKDATDAIAKASAEASKKAMEAVKDAYESNAAKIKLHLKIGAPEIFVPRSLNSNEVLTLVLGEFEINNALSAVPTNNASRNAIVDTATISLSGVSVGKAILDDNTDIRVQSAFIEPITLKFDFGRNLSSSWHKEIPQFRVDADLEQFIVIISSQDLNFGSLCLLDVGKSLLRAKAPAKKQEVDSLALGEPQERMGTIQIAGSVQEAPEETPAAKSWMFSLKGTIKKIGVQFYTGPTNLDNQSGSVPRDPGLSIGECSIQNASCSAEVWTNMDITAQFALNDAIIRDTRQSTTSVITDAITRKAGRVGESVTPILAMNFSQTVQPNGEKLIDAGCQTTGAELVLNFEFLKAVLDVLMQIKDDMPKIIEEAKNCQKALTGAADEPSDEVAVEAEAPTEVVEEAKPSNLRINAKVRFEEVNVLVLEDASRLDSNAVEITFGGSFDLNSKVTETHGNGEIKLGLATTNYRTRAVKKLAEIIRMASLQIKVDLTPERKIDVDVVYPELACRFSAGTILLLAKIGSVAGKAFAAKDEAADAEEDNSDAWVAKENGGQDYWFMKPDLTPVRKKNVIFLSGAVENVGNEIKERIGFTIQSLAISLEVGQGSLTTPLVIVDGSLGAEVTNFSSDLAISCAYNNRNVGAWEYLIEPSEVPKAYGDPTFRPWGLQFSASKPKAKDDSSPAPPITVNISSDEFLEITASKTGIAALKKIGQDFAKSATATVSEDEVKSTPYSFKNDVGTPLTLTIEETSPFVYVKNDEVVYGNIDVQAGETVDLGLNLHITSTENQKSTDDRILTISIPEFQFSQTVNVGRNEAKFFPINRTSLLGDQEGFIIDVVNEGFSIAITARSLIQVKNEIDIPVDILTEQGRTIGTVQPAGSLNVPYDTVYSSAGGLFVKPNGFKVSQIPLKWISLKEKPKLLWSPVSSDEIGRGDSTFFKVLGEQIPVMEGNTNRPTRVPQNFVLTLKAQVVINNLLPTPVEVVLKSGTQYNVESGRSFNAFSLPPGNFEKEFVFLMRLPNFRGQSWTGQAHLQSTDQLLSSVTFTSQDRQQSLCIGYKTDGKEDGKKVSKSDPVTISLYCSYWMVNYTGLNLSYKSADGPHVVQHTPTEPGPVLIGPERSLGRGAPTPATLIKCENSGWSQPLPLDNNTGVPTVIFLREATRDYQLTVSCEMSNCGLSRIVTISSRYNIVNSCPYPIYVEEVDVPNRVAQVPALQSIAWWPKGRAQRIKVKAQDTEEYTADISYQTPFDNILRLPNKRGGIRASISPTQTSTSITFSKYTEMEVPLLIVNDTPDAVIEFHQQGQASRQVSPGQGVQFAWDDFHTPETLEWTVQGCPVPHTLNFTRDQTGEVVVGGKKFKWITFTRHLRRILLLTQNFAVVEAINNLKKVEDEKPSVDVTLAFSGIGISVVDNVAGKDLLYIRLSSMPPTWEAKADKNFKKLSIDQNDLVENGFQNYLQGVLPPGQVLQNNLELDYQAMTMKGKTGLYTIRRFDPRPAAKVLFKMFPSSMTVELKIHDLQVDNQTLGAKEVICFDVTPIPHTVTTKSDVHPCIFILKGSIVNPANSSLELISADVCLQEFDLRADMNLANSMMDFIKAEPGNADEYLESYKADYVLGSKKEADFYAEQFAKSATSKKITIYEKVDIHSLKLNLTFSLDGVGGGSFMSMFAGLGSALIDITDKELAIDGMKMEHMRLNMAEFGDHVYQHYKSAVMSNMMSLMCGLDVIGNPVKLFGGISKGLSTMFMDPMSAAMDGNILDGVSSGAQGAAMIVGSVTDSVAGVTGALGKGLDALGFGFLGSSLGQISGALKNPKGGPGGVKKATRMRQPRNLGPNVALKPLSQVLAAGETLKSQIDPEDQTSPTIAYVVTNDHSVFLLTTTYAYYADVHRDMKTLSEKIWSVPLRSVDDVTLAGTVLLLHSRQQQNLGPIIFSDPEMAKWVVQKTQEAIRTAPPPPAHSATAGAGGQGYHPPAQPSLLGGLDSLFGGLTTPHPPQQQTRQQQPSLFGGLGGIIGGGQHTQQQYGVRQPPPRQARPPQQNFSFF